MPTELEIRSLHPGGRAMFCLHLAKALPPLPSGIKGEIGKTNVALVSSVLYSLESATSDDDVNLEELSVGLRTIVALVQRKTQEIENREYRPGDNYGFTGAADTYAEIYRYLSAFIRTVAYAVVFDAEGCVNTFRGALKLYGMYSVDGDPKGAIRQAVEEAEEQSGAVITDAYASIPEALKHWRGELPRQAADTPETQFSPAVPSRSSASTDAQRHHVFISYSHRDKKWLSELQTMLKPLVRVGLIEVWDDNKIKPGATWKTEIERALASAKVAVLLVTANFLASDFIASNELPPLLQAARDRGLVVLWIYFSSCLYEITEIANFQAAHGIGRALDRMPKPNRQAVLSEVCGYIRNLLA